MNPFAALGRFVVRFRWVIVVVWLVGAPLAAKHMPSLSSVAKNDNSAFLPASAPSERAASLATPFQPKSKGTALLVAVRADGPLTSADERAIAHAATAVGRVPVVQAVRDEGTSADGHAEKIALLLDLPPFGGGDQATNAIDAIRHAMAGTAAPPGLALHLAGAIPTFVDEQKATGHMQGVTQELAIVFIIALLLVVFRAALAPLVTLFPAALALVLAGPLIAEATHIGVQVSSLLQLLLVVIVLGAGTDYGLFLIFRIREELRAGRDPKDAVVVSVTRVGESITFSGITVIAALASLLLASFGLYRGLGPGLAIGIAVVLIANLTLLPALLALIGRAVFWPFIPKPGPTRRSTWGAVATRVVGHPLRTLVIGVVVFGGLALAVLDYSPAGFGAPTVGATSDSAQGQAALDRALRHRRVESHQRGVPPAHLGVAAACDPGPGGGGPHGDGQVQRRGRWARSERPRWGLHARAVERPVPHARPAPVAARHATAELDGPTSHLRRLPGHGTVRERGRPHHPLRHLAGGRGPRDRRRAQRHPGGAQRSGDGGDAHRRAGQRRRR